MRYSTIKIEKFIHFLKIFHFFPIFFAVSYENFQFNNKILIIFFITKTAAQNCAAATYFNIFYI